MQHFQLRLVEHGDGGGKHNHKRGGKLCGGAAFGAARLEGWRAVASGARGSEDAVVSIIIIGDFARRIARSLFQCVDEASTDHGLGGAHHGDKKEEDCLVLHCEVPENKPCGGVRERERKKEKIHREGNLKGQEGIRTRNEMKRVRTDSQIGFLPANSKFLPTLRQ